MSNIKCPKCGSLDSSKTFANYFNKGLAVGTGIVTKFVVPGLIAAATRGRIKPNVKAGALLNLVDDEYKCNSCGCEFSVSKSGTVSVN